MPAKRWTPEQRKAASERAKARIAAQSATAVDVAEPEEDSDDDVLSQLAATIMKARDKKQNQRKLLDDLGKILDQIDPKEHPELADDPAIEQFMERIGAQRIKEAQEHGLRPGTVIGTGLAQRDVPWTEADLTHPEWGCVDENGQPIYVEFIPNETIPVFYQGIRCQLIADQPIKVLRCFYDVYMEHKRLTKIAEQHRAYMFGRADSLPAELVSGDAAVATARVRAFMSMGGEKGGGRVVVGYPGDANFELREVPAGGGEATQ